jgi:hypothetical protein
VLQTIPAALVSADGLNITTEGRGGGEVRTLSLAAHESATVVTLSLEAVPASCPCATDLIIEPVHVMLTRPLGGRRLVDAATGSSITHMDGATLVAVDWLPVGYPSDPSDGLAATASSTLGWSRSYTALNPANSNVITVTQLPGDHLADPDFVGYRPEPIDINGTTGQLWHSGGADQGYAFPVVSEDIGWQLNGVTLEVASSVSTIGPNQAVLTQSDLIHIARNLTKPR